MSGGQQRTDMRQDKKMSANKCQVCSVHLKHRRADARFCSPRCKQRAYRRRNGSRSRIVTSAVSGRNADLIASAASLYLKPGMRVADVTYGKGLFWRKVDTTRFDFLPTDLKDGIDFRNLPYRDHSLDVLVLDPPYMSTRMTDTSLTDYNDAYRVTDSFDALGIRNNADVLRLYAEGMTEAHRVVKPKGMVWIKCQDTVDTHHRQAFNHITIHNTATDLGWYPKDLFVLVPNTNIPNRWPYQKHARKNHSFLWIMETP